MAGSDKKYDSSVNIIGSVPDYGTMIDYICKLNGINTLEDNFKFRTEKATSRFKTGITKGFLIFFNDKHKSLFLEALSSRDFSYEEKILVLFWQLIYNNLLFREITENVFFRLLFAGRTTLGTSDVEAFVKYVRNCNPDDLPLSDSTVKTLASKYLTILKKFGLADGKVKKTIKAPHISPKLFNYLVRMALTIYADEPTLKNPMFKYSFLDNNSIINRLKSIENIPNWDITQIGNDITIALK